MIAEGMFSLLSGLAGVSTLVGDRIYPAIVPTGAPMPAVTWQIMTARKVQQGLTTRMPRPLLVQIEAWGSTYLEAATVRDALIEGLNMQLAGLELPGGLILRGAFFETPLDFYAEGDEQYRLGAEFCMHFQFPAN